MSKLVKLFEENSGTPEYQEKYSEYMVPFRDTPRLEMQFLRLTREVEIQNTLFTLLTEQFEQAKLQEARDTPTLLTLDVAVPPIKRSSPKRTITVLIVTGMAFIFTVFVAFTF